jgi:hypothetical protein
MLVVASADGLLSPLNSRATTLHVSLYADDVAVFVKPTKEEVLVVAKILEIFGYA